jgi:hypothetical protein
MRHILAVALALFSVVAFSTPARAQGKGKTGMDLKEWCKETPATDLQYSRDAWCDGFLSGYMYFAEHSPVPGNVTVGQLELVLIKYLDEHPEKLNLPADQLLLMSVKNAWGREGGR